MKIRTGFVSNSSSSSFTCGVCGIEASGWDLSLRDAEMVECKRGHLFCKDHIDSTQREKLDDEDNPNWNEDWRYGLESENCPLCSFATISQDVLIKYMFKELETSQLDIENEIRTKFKSIVEFDTFMSKQQKEKEDVDVD